MQIDNLIAIEEFCVNYNIEISFISSLQQTGLVEITTINEIGYIDIAQLQQLEKFIRFYFDLDINMEGIETISHLLKQIDTLQNEITSLQNRLRLYETGI